jgi:AraC family transcriptional activator FtrA
MYSSQRSVAVLAYDGLCTFEFALAVEVFGLRRPELGVPWYDFKVCAAERGPLRAEGGVTLQVAHGLRALEGAGTVVVPGWRHNLQEPIPQALIAALRRAHARGARLVSICSGAFVLAATGLLDGRRATTHWRYTKLFAERFPRVRLVPDVLYVDEGQLLTSAGSAAGLDLCMHLVRKDYGAAIANEVARRLVIPPHREGGQAQFVPEPISPVEGGSPLAPLLGWALENLREPISVRRLAHRAGMSERTFCRRFYAQTGTSPARWLICQRVIAAQRLLEVTPLAVEIVADRVGMGTATNLRHHFHKHLRTTPIQYRRTFRGEGDDWVPPVRRGDGRRARFTRVTLQG